MARAAAWYTLVCLLAVGLPTAALADADEAPVAGSAPAGLQPIASPFPAATPFPGESRTVARADGTVQAIPERRGRTEIYHLVARPAPWTLRPGLTVMARTYNGVVPGPTLVVRQGDRVVIDYRNELDVPDTIHLHGIHGIPVTMDGVPGSSQRMVAPHGTFQYIFRATDPGTFIYHTHDRKAILNSGLYGGIIVEPSAPRPEERSARDYLEIISSWYINSTSESAFTLNGKSYPATHPIDVRRGERIRIRWINISAENFHTMHTHGHYQRLIARDAMPVAENVIEDTVELGPGQRVDVTVDANQSPGTWMVHCHVLDHTENADGMPDGLITAIHYLGTPNTMTAMQDEMMRAMPMTATGIGTAAGIPGNRLSFWTTVGLGAFAGLTIFLGLPIARARHLKLGQINILNAFAIGILAYLVIEIATGAVGPVSQAVVAWHRAALPFPFALSAALAAGLLIGLVGLGSISTTIVRHGAKSMADHPIPLAMMIAVGIGAHNLAEGLAIGASAAAGSTAIAAGLVIGFALHNATEGFGIAAPLAGRVVPSWAQIGLAGLVAGGPTFLGTMIGYQFTSPVLSVFFLAIAVGALIFVIGELWSVLKRTGLTIPATTMITLGFGVAFVTELLVDINGG